MNKFSVPGIFLSVFLLSGCQNALKTMVAHISIDNQETAFLAQGNAFTNFCLSRSLLNKQNAYEFSTVAAQYLDLVVFDNDFYKTTYESTVAEITSSAKRVPGEVVPGCRDLEDRLPQVTANLYKKYRTYVQELGVARSEENRQLAQTMNSFRLPSTPMPVMAFPNVPYSPEKSRSQNILINTPNGGLTHCRVTNSNFVFCL